MDVSIAPLERASELEALIPLDRQLNGERDVGEVLKEYRSYTGLILAARQGAAVLGFGTVSFPYWNRVAMIDHVAVLKESRRQGIGRQLCEALSDRATRWGARILAVQTATWNEGAIGFYEELGFKQRAVLPAYMGKDNDLVWLDAVLDPG